MLQVITCHYAPFGAAGKRHAGSSCPTEATLAVRSKRAAVPRAWPPPPKFRTEIWGVGQVVGPYGWLREAPRDCRGSA